MARPRKAAEPPKTPPQQVARKVTPEKELTKLLKARKAMKNDVDSAVGAYRENIARAVDKHHLHKKAFGAITSIINLEDEKLAEFFDHFDHYCDISGIRARAEAAPRLDLGDQPGEGEEDEDEAEASNVTTLRGNGASANIG